MEVIQGLNIVGSSTYIKTDDFVIYVAKNPFWADCNTNELIAKVKGANAIAVNMVDAEDSKYFQVKIFKYLIRTIYDKMKSGQSITLVCNKGQSRSASVALLFMAVIGEISNESYRKAKAEFLSYYPDYSPGIGISSFLDKTWKLFFTKNN